MGRRSASRGVREMLERIQKELELLKREYPTLEYNENGHWIKISDYKLPLGLWNREQTTIVFQIPSGYPGQAPYGFFVEVGFKLKKTDRKPSNYEEPVSGVGFEGQWGKFSWQHENWFASEDVLSGSNLLHFARSFRDRFLEEV
jgi:hypothetical protein